MSHPGKDVPAAGSEAGANIGFTYEDLQVELRLLYDRLNYKLGPGEFTTRSFAEANGLSIQKATDAVGALIRKGEVEQKEYKKNINGKANNIYHIVKKE